MSVRIKEDNVIMEFPLTQPKRSWKIRRVRGTRPSNLRVGYEISAGDLFEWMVSNDEILDMLFGLDIYQPRSMWSSKPVFTP